MWKRWKRCEKVQKNRNREKKKEKKEKEGKIVKNVKKMWKSAKKRPARPSFPSIDWSQQSLSLSPQFLSTRPAPVPGSDPPQKESAIPSPHFPQACTCSRFRLPPKKKVRSTLHNFCKLAPVPGPNPPKKKKSAVDLPHFLKPRPSTCSKFRPQKKSAVRPSTFSVS